METTTNNPAPKPKRNLFVQLNPNTTLMAKATGLSRVTLKAVVEGSGEYQRRDGKPTQFKPDTINRFNAYLDKLFQERVALAKKLSSRG